MATTAEKRICTWTPGLPELSCDGSIVEAINGGAVRFKMEVSPVAWESVRGARRIAVIDPEAWRAEVEVENVERIDEDTVHLTLRPADFTCDRCDGILAGAVCDLCKEGRIPAHAIKGEYFTEGQGTIRWRPCEN